MRVLFEASILGEGFRHPSRRTGMYRGADETLVELASRGSPDVSLSAARSWKAVHDVGEYQQWRGLKGLPIVTARGPRELMLSIARTEEQLAEAVPGLRTAVNKAAALRGLTLDRMAPPLDAKTIAGHDVFHLPGHWIPPIDRPARTGYVVMVQDIIADTHPEFGNRWSREALRALRHAISPRDVLLAGSEFVRDELVARWGISPDRIVVTMNGVSGQSFHPAGAEEVSRVRAAHGIADLPFVLAANRLEPRKNLPRLVRSFIALARDKSAPPCVLVLAGDDRWDPSSLFTSPEDRDLARRKIVLIGRVSDDDLAALYSSASAFVFPSLLEGFGLPALEAMQCGAPVITSNTSSLPEVVGDAGVLVDPRDEGAITSAMLGLLQSPSRRADLSRRGIERAKQFTWSIVVDRVVRAYELSRQF